MVAIHPARVPAAAPATASVVPPSAPAQTPPEPGPKPVDLARMPSVRSEAYKDATSGAPAAVAPAARAAATTGDDLKRIKGVGIVVAKKLAGLGVTSYAQIAAWTQGDIDKMNELLGASGKIERDGWVEQARILAGGGLTDFARRVDRGEIDLGRR